MRVLVLEDEDHKVKDLTARLMENDVREDHIIVCGGVTDGVLTVGEMDFDLVVLDMALPTFSDKTGGRAVGGLAQAVGGIEVLRTLHALGKRFKVIVVTQYPDIIVSGLRVKLANVGKVLSEKYDQRVLGAVLYSYKSQEWASAFDALFRRAK